MQFRVQGFRFKKIFRGGAKLTELLVLIYEKQRKMLAPQNVQNFHSKLILSISKHFRHRNSKIQWVYQYKCSKWRTKEVMNCCCFVEHTQSLAWSVNHRCTIPKQEKKMYVPHRACNLWIVTIRTVEIELIERSVIMDKFSVPFQCNKRQNHSIIIITILSLKYNDCFLYF